MRVVDTESLMRDYRSALADGAELPLVVSGGSMRPFLAPGRDTVYLRAPDRPLRRGDIAFYRRADGQYVLHRICRITRDGFYLVGDNQTEVEGPLSPEQIHGRLTGVVRNGKSFSVSHPIYRMLSSIWLFLRPVRPFFWSVTAFFRRFFQKH